MSLKLVLLILVVAGLVGIGLGYFLRYLVALGKRGSVELEIKQKLLDAQEQSKKLTEAAEKKAQEILEESRSEAKKREEELKKTEDRLIKQLQNLRLNAL